MRIDWGKEARRWERMGWITFKVCGILVVLYAICSAIEYYCAPR